MRRLSLLILLVLAPGCWRGAGILPCLCGTAVATSLLVSSTPPPPPPPQYIAPQPRSGYVWQPGYWASQGGQWVWVEGHWAREQRGYGWQPTHWEQAPDGSWHQIPGRWVPVN